MSGIRPTGLLCDDRKNPLGVDVPHPSFCFHWEQVQASVPPEMPEYFRIRVAASKAAFHSHAHDLWNSGWISSAELLRAKYNGTQLRSRERYFWQVETRLRNGEAGLASTVAWFEMGLLDPQDWTAAWIMGIEETFPSAPDDLACGYRHYADWEIDWVNEETSDYAGESPLFRREFVITKPVRKARLYYCGLGWSEAYLNARKVSEDVHSPAFTDYDDRDPALIVGHSHSPHRDYRGRRHRVLYRVYDVTAMLTEGKNALGLWLGNGYFNDPLQRKGAKPRAICQLEITYRDGSKETFASNSTDWTTSPSPIVYNEMVLGEVYDARRETDGWNAPNFDASSWEQAYPATAPSKAVLRVQTCPSDRVIRIYDPELIAAYRDSVRLYDLGDQIAGWVKIAVRGSKGERVDIRFAQNYLCGALHPFLGKVSKLTYILRGEGVEVYCPRFMWAGFRYIEVTTNAEIVHLEGQRVATDVPHTGRFRCSDRLWNTLYTAAINTVSNHFQAGLAIDDCHLERRCYTGTVVMNSYWASICFDPATIYRKWLVDLADAQHLELGCFPDTVPYQCGAGNLYQGIPIIDLPYELYLHTGDTDILAANLEAMERWLQFLDTCTDGGFVIQRIYDGVPFIGDWLWPGLEAAKPGAISAIEYDGFDKRYVNSCLYAHAVGRMIEILQILGKDATPYVALKANISRAILSRWYHPDSHTFAEGRHGAEALALWADIVPPEERQAVADAMARHIVERCQGHLDTGCYATPRLLAMLTRYHHADVAAGIMRQTTYPSHGFMLRNGHPTIWEYFEGVRNNNQPIFATFVEWMLTDVLGISPDPCHPGYRNIILHPKLLQELRWVEGYIHTPMGKAGARWERTAEHTLLKALIPLGSTGQVRVPAAMADISVDGSTVRAFETAHERWVTIDSGEHTVIFK
jgi:alpha-L-rhamnosidase